MNVSKSDTRDAAFQSRRRDLRRLAALGLVALAVVSGCQSTGGNPFKKDRKRDQKTVDDVLNADRPGW